MSNKNNSRIQFMKKIRVFHYIFFNYFCKNVVREDQSKVIPYKNAVLEFEPNSKLYLKGGDLEIGCDKLSGSKAETRVRLRNHAEWKSDGGSKISYGCTLEVLSDARLDSRYFTMNSDSVIIVGNHMDLGNDVMIARNVVIYDSDFHDLFDEEGRKLNSSTGVKIGDHVWIGTNSMILKGVKIATGSIIAAGTIVTTDVNDKILAGNQNIICEIRKNINWKR